ncbi:MAG: metallophosphoesterase family protein [Planctomycetaceae bacterium]
MASSKTETGRLIAIGDIHGHAAALESVLAAIAPEPNDTVVTLGDYVNRGPESRRVLDLLIDLSNRCQLIPILGNHEEMMLDSRNDPHAELRWKSQGGEATLASYGPDTGIGHIPQSHWNFLLACRPYYETDNFVFTHANYCWYSQLENQPAALLRWLSLQESTPKAHLNGKTFVVGHTPGSIRDYGFCLCFDTGCGFGGRLTAFELNTRHTWQVEEDGEWVTPDGIDIVT